MEKRLAGLKGTVEAKSATTGREVKTIVQDLGGSRALDVHVVIFLVFFGRFS